MVEESKSQKKAKQDFNDFSQVVKTKMSEAFEGVSEENILEMIKLIGAQSGKLKSSGVQ